MPLTEDQKFYTDRFSVEPVASIHGGPHVLVSFALEDGGSIGAHAQALLRPLAVVALEKGKSPSFAYMASAHSAPTLTSL
jgi:hypothetical protein